MHRLKSIYTMRYKTIDKIVGWLVFAVAAVTYCLTIEPTASFWDCPEFITTGFKLEVGHPPGAPFFMLTANLFSQLTDDTAKVAMMVNIMSALLSALCILFLFWTITILVKKLLCQDGKEPDVWQTVTIMASGVVGALAYTWSDTFWFSAVEGEVYAYSSFCTAVTFWLILKWEEDADRPHSDRWLVLIAYIIGLSVGVHLLNLLCITAIVLVYYFRKAENPSWRGGLLSFVLSGVIIAAVLYGIVPGIVKVGGWFELLFVNGLGGKFNTGLIIYLVLLVASVIWGVAESQKAAGDVRMKISFLITLALTGIPFYGHKAGGVVFGILVLALLAFYLLSGKISAGLKPSPRVLNTIMLSIMCIFIGYSSYALIVIRSTANPPMDQNSPEDIFTLGDYLAREQYGSRPLLYGQTYASQVALRPEGNACYPIFNENGNVYGRKEKSSGDEKDRYYVQDVKRSYKYAQNMLFPRMYSSDKDHVQQYKSWANIKGRTVIYDRCGKTMKLNIPTQMENLRFFFRYQVNFMYWRYFMWNFCGRQNDIQGHGEIMYGNWITGINFIDRALVGDQRLLPESLKGKGHNVFYGLPLLLGLIGLFWQTRRGKEGVRQFWVVCCLFFMTGLAIVVYLNQTPLQPRERDYAYAASFYAYAIWIGLGVAGVASLLGKLLGSKASSVLAAVLCLFVPMQMVGQTWDDHDRSGRYTCRDFGQNYLTTLPEKGNPIIFSNGDNDTFPLWYNLETEGFRTDCRVCNLSYLMTDWYIDQMKRPAYESPSVPIEFERIDYETGTNDFVDISPESKKAFLQNAKTQADIDKIDESFELRNILEYWVKKYHVIPTDTIWFRLDKEAILNSGMMIPERFVGATREETIQNLPDRMIISLKGKTVLYKNELMMLEMLAYCNWERPLYMATTVGISNHLGLDPYFVLEGLAYRITPFNWVEMGYAENKLDNYMIDTDRMYENLMKFKFGGLDNPDVYLDETIRRMVLSHRRLYAQLADALIEKGENEKALQVLDRLESGISSQLIPHDILGYSQMIAHCYLRLGENEKAIEICKQMADRYLEDMQWYLSLDNSNLMLVAADFDDDVTYLCDALFPILKSAGLDKETYESLTALFEDLYVKFRGRVG